jgi:hypothetical protein
MSRRIQDKMDLVRIYMVRNGGRLYKWGLTQSEIDSHLHYALWQFLLYIDAHPNDELSEYRRFWRFARREFGNVWRTMNHAKGRPGENLYEFNESPEDLDTLKADSYSNPEDLVTCLRALDSLTDRQKAILGALPGSGNRRCEAVAEQLGEASGDVVLKQLAVVREVILTGEAPNTQGIKAQITDFLGMEHDKAASIRCKNVLAVARRELDLSIPRGSRYNRKQCDQVMG